MAQTPDRANAWSGWEPSRCAALSFIGSIAPPTPACQNRFYGRSLLGPNFQDFWRISVKTKALIVCLFVLLMAGVSAMAQQAPAAAPPLPPQTISVPTYTT